jgi:hypothetical protein
MGGAASRLEGRQMMLHHQAKLASWPTPQAEGVANPRDLTTRVKGDRQTRDPTRIGNTRKDLADVAGLASWPTPMAGTPAQKGYNEAGNTDSGRKTVDLVSWPTPAANEPGGTPEMAHQRKLKAVANGSQIGTTPATHLSYAAQLAPWPTPTATDDKNSGTESFTATKGNKGLRLSDHMVTRGPISSGSPASTEKRGQLNPDFTRFLMGYPAEHLSCAPMAMRSSLKRPRHSSERS